MVYIINLPSSSADEEILKSVSYFGQYGKITKCTVNKSNVYANSTTGPSFGAYITYSSHEEATTCIKACDGFILNGKPLTLTFGTTKYCAFFLKSVPCPKTDCLYLHKLAPQSDTLPREVMPHNRHIKPHNLEFDKVSLTILPPAGNIKLPIVKIEKSVSHQYAKTLVKFRTYSRDSDQSRFDFVQETDEMPAEIENKVLDLVKNISPCKEIVEVNSNQYRDILSPASPDKWAQDILQVVRVKKSSILASKCEDNIYVVAPKASGVFNMA